MFVKIKIEDIVDVYCGGDCSHCLLNNICDRVKDVTISINYYDKLQMCRGVKGVFCTNCEFRFQCWTR